MQRDRGSGHHRRTFRHSIIMTVLAIVLAIGVGHPGRGIRCRSDPISTRTPSRVSRATMSPERSFSSTMRCRRTPTCLPPTSCRARHDSGMRIRKEPKRPSISRCSSASTGRKWRCPWRGLCGAGQVRSAARAHFTGGPAEGRPRSRFSCCVATRRPKRAIRTARCAPSTKHARSTRKFDRRSAGAGKRAAADRSDGSGRGRGRGDRQGSRRTIPPPGICARRWHT